MPKWSLAGITGQEDQRRVETFLDQHGREYTANIEITTGDPCSAIMPIDWIAPSSPEWFRGLLMPPEHLRQMVHRMERARKRYQIEINYTQWLAEIDKRDDDWDSRLANLAQSSTKGFGFADVIANPPAALLEYLGPKAFPPRVFVEAMAAGDKWSLGMSDRVPSKAVLLLKELEPYVTKRRVRRLGGGLVNPFADESEEIETENVFADVKADNPFGGNDEGDEGDALDDLDEMFDPKAEGGKVEKKNRRRAER